jgi:hypothetical protein
LNVGTTPIALNQLWLKYWFTSETPDKVSCLSGACQQTFEAFASPYSGATILEIEFTSEAGMLSAGAAIEVDLQIDSTFDQTKDWSYSSSTSFTVNPHVTAYTLSGLLVAGTQPQ